MIHIELAQEVVNYFGKEELERQKALGLLNNFAGYISNKYLKMITPPIVFDETIKSDAIYNVELDASIINTNISNDFYTSLKACIHELRHFYQRKYIDANNDEISKVWKYEFDNYITEDNLDDYLNQQIELDAYAFTQYVVEHELKGCIEIIDPIIQSKINKIKEKYNF